MSRKILEEEEFYKLIYPMHTFIVTTISIDGKPNACAAAWVTPISEEPPIIALTLSKEHLTSRNIREIGEFVLNVPSVRLLDVVLRVGTKSGRKIDKTKVKGMTYVPAKHVKAPRVKESIAHIECRVRETFEIGDSFEFLSDVLHCEVETEFFSLLWKDEALPLLHMGGREFAAPVFISGNIIVKVKPYGRAKGRLSFENPITTQKIMESVPLSGKVNLFKNGLYLETNLNIPIENPKRKVKRGDIAFWPERSAVCIFFGKPSIKSFSAPGNVNIFGKIKKNIEILENIEPGKIITIDRL